MRRYGCLFEDARGPQVLHIRSRYDTSAPAASSGTSEGGGDGPAGGETVTGVVVPASSYWVEGVVQSLQTFGILFQVLKMVLFALIINGGGGIDNIAQVLALVAVSAAHLLYLRLCLPYRLRVELAAEMVASACDLGVFSCGIALVAKREWSEAQRERMGLAMLVLQAVGFLTFISVRLALALRTVWITLAPMASGLCRCGALRQRRGGAPPTGALL